MSSSLPLLFANWVVCEKASLLLFNLGRSGEQHCPAVSQSVCLVIYWAWSRSNKKQSDLQRSCHPHTHSWNNTLIRNKFLVCLYWKCHEVTLVSSFIQEGKKYKKRKSITKKDYNNAGLAAVFETQRDLKQCSTTESNDYFPNYNEYNEYNYLINNCNYSVLFDFILFTSSICSSGTWSQLKSRSVLKLVIATLTTVKRGTSHLPV